MKKLFIEPAPALSAELLAQLPGNEIGNLSSIFKRANDEYVYWDKFKQRQYSSQLDVKELWGVLHIIRQVQLKKIPLKNIDGKKFGYWLPDRAQRLLHKFDLLTAGEIVTEPELINSSSQRKYVINSLMEEAIASSKIEGAATSRKVAKELLRTGRKPDSRAEKMIVNNFATIQKIRDLKNDPLTPEMLLELQALLTYGTLDDPGDCGKFRTTDDICVFDGRRDVILHEPPLSRNLPERLALLCEFANGGELDGDFMHPIVKAVLLHFWLAYDHPFADGNGRTARAVFYWYMLKSGYWMFEHLSISRNILHSRGQYERAYLYSEQDGADATYFIMYNLGVIEKALEDLKAFLDRKRDEQKRISLLLKGVSALNHRQQALMKHAMNNSGFVYTIESHRNSHGVSYPTARQDLIYLAEKGLLSIDKSKRSWRFTVPSDLLDRLS